MKTKQRVTTQYVEPISDRHRRYGFLLPAADVDFLMLEYGNGKPVEPVALVEYKRRPLSAVASGERTSIAAIGRLGDRAGIPSYAVTYNAETWTFVVEPTNERAAALALATPGLRLSEAEYVEFLYALRGRTPPAEVIALCL